jgi:hypothetical protein
MDESGLCVGHRSWVSSGTPVRFSSLMIKPTYSLTLILNKEIVHCSTHWLCLEDRVPIIESAKVPNVLRTVSGHH